MVIVLHTKNNVKSNLKSNLTFVKIITSKYYRSTGLMIIYNVGISLLIISAFSCNLSLKYYTYEDKA